MDQNTVSAAFNLHFVGQIRVKLDQLIYAFELEFGEREFPFELNGIEFEVANVESYRHGRRGT